MSSASAIEWTDASWNPVTGCTRVPNPGGGPSGCDNCYAKGMTHRLEAMAKADEAAGKNPGRKRDYVGLTVLNNAGEVQFNGKVKCHADALNIPFGYGKRPRKVFVNSMSDLFHKDVPLAFIIKVLAVIACNPQHTFQILTKRPDVAYDVLTNPLLPGAIYRTINDWMDEGEDGFLGKHWDRVHNLSGWRSTGDYRDDGEPQWNMPLANMWLLASVANQGAADQYVPWILKCPAVVRGVSFEPALGPVDFSNIQNGSEHYKALDGKRQNVFSDAMQNHPRLDWVIAGVESTNGKFPGRFADKANGYVLSAVEQCQAAGVPVYVKQIVVRRGDKLRVSGDPNCGWPREFRVRQWPAVAAGEAT